MQMNVCFMWEILTENIPCEQKCCTIHSKVQTNAELLLFVKCSILQSPTFTILALKGEFFEEVDEITDQGSLTNYTTFYLEKN